MIPFFKYQGTGNDFVLIDNRNLEFSLSQSTIAKMCHRRFGIGADGLMLLQNEPGYDFRMVYYNSDGRESSMCGNGGRCISAFAAYLGIVRNNAKFLAIDGEHEAIITSGIKPLEKIVSLKMVDVSDWKLMESGSVMDTGSPHFTIMVDSAENTDVFNEGKKIRNRSEFSPDGINVNFVSHNNGRLHVRTYERGVEDETFSCGTGVTAAALTHALLNKTETGSNEIITSGGELKVGYKMENEKFTDIWLTGPAELVFRGEVNEYI